MANLMIIDDDMMLSRALAEQLSLDGHDVKSYFMAEEGFKAAVQTPPDLIFLDVMLPDATGFQIVARLREHLNTKGVPVIMMTGNARYPNQQEIGKRMGAQEYLIKPLQSDNISEIVQRLLTLKPAPPSESLVPDVKPVFEQPIPTDPPSEIETIPPSPSTETSSIVPLVLWTAADKNQEKEEKIAWTGKRLAAALLLVHGVAVIFHGWQGNQTLPELLRSGLGFMAGWALLMGLVVAASVSFRIAVSAEQTFGAMVFPAIPIVLRTLTALFGYKFTPPSLAPQLYWLRPFNVYEVLAILLLAIRFRRFPGVTLRKAVAVSFLIALSWCVTNRGYFQP